MPATSCPFPFSPPSNKRRLPAFVLCLLLHAVFLSILDTAMAAEQSRTLQSFGVHLKSGQPVHPLPSNVALGLFNPDPLLDVAYFAEDKVQVYQNMGNGLFDLVGVKRLTGAIERMEWRKEKMFPENIPNQFSWGELCVCYDNGRIEVIPHEQFAAQSNYLNFTSQPPMNPLLDFREVWRSEGQSQPSPFMALADIDNDGHSEVAYSFGPNHCVVFKCVGNDSCAFDWDTVITNSDGPFAVSDVDNNGHKEIVLARSTQNGQLVLLECVAPRRYRYYATNIFYFDPPFKVLETDIDHDGVRELCLLTSNPSAPPGQDATFIYIAEFAFKDSTTMWFSIQTARYYGYTFDMAVGQVDGMGRDEIIPASGSFGINEPIPIDYLWYNGTSWTTRWIYTGLRSGTTAPMFVNLDADTTKELFIGGVGPIGHGSCYALDYVGDTTWRVMWSDSSLRNTPLCVGAGLLAGEFVIAGANTWNPTLDTLYTRLHVYISSGIKKGIWQLDSGWLGTFQLLDINNDGRANLIAPIGSYLMPSFLANYEYFGPTYVTDDPKVGSGGFQLFPNYPNPFNPTTEIKFDLPEAALVSLVVYDILGRTVEELVNENREAGYHSATWNAADAASGVYLARLTISNEFGRVQFTKMNKLILMK